MRTAILLSLGVGLLASSSMPADDKVPKEGPKPASQSGGVGDYLAKDGKLKETLTLRKDMTGLATVNSPKAEVWVIQPTGEWTSKVAGAKGKLSTEQLAALGQHLTTQGFNSLPNTQGYEQQVLDEVYQRIIIEFGKKSATFNIKMGKTPIDYLPKLGDPQAAAWSRFVALELVLTDLFRSSGTKGK
jgi:hypothetical protein